MQQLLLDTKVGDNAVEHAASDWLPLPNSLLAPARWSRVAVGSWSGVGPIHEMEARIALEGLRRSSLRIRDHDSRLLSIGDNMA